MTTLQYRQKAQCLSSASVLCRSTCGVLCAVANSCNGPYYEKKNGYQFFVEGSFWCVADGIPRKYFRPIFLIAETFCSLMWTTNCGRLPESVKWGQCGSPDALLSESISKTRCSKCRLMLNRSIKCIGPAKQTWVMF